MKAIIVIVVNLTALIFASLIKLVFPNFYKKINKIVLHKVRPSFLKMLNVILCLTVSFYFIIEFFYINFILELKFVYSVPVFSIVGILILCICSCWLMIFIQVLFYSFKE